MYRDKAKEVTNKSKIKSKSFKITIAIDYRYDIISIEIKRGSYKYDCWGYKYISRYKRTF